MTTHWLDHLSRSLTHDHDGSKHSFCNSVVLVNPRKTTVKATNICPLKRSNTYNPYSPLKWPNGATIVPQWVTKTKMDKATGPSKGRVNSSICKGLTHLRHCGTVLFASTAGILDRFRSCFSPTFLVYIYIILLYICIYTYVYIYIYRDLKMIFG